MKIQTDNNSPKVQQTDNHLYANYTYRTTSAQQMADGRWQVRGVETPYQFKTDLKTPRTGLMMVGWAGNNGSTVTASILANRKSLSWRTREGTQSANYLGSLVMSATLKLGTDPQGRDVYVPFHDMLPMVHPNDMVIGGWDINGANLAEAMERACVLEPDLQQQVAKEMAGMKPLPSVYYPDFIAANQGARADNVLPGDNKGEHLAQLRADMREFKAKHQLEKLVVLWTATTERFADIIPGVNDTANNILSAIKANHPEIAPSHVFAVASILEGAIFINGSPQNTFVPGILDLAEQHRAFIAGDDFKSGQTKIKSVLMDFLVGAGIKPLAVTSYNHLGNNDGLNLSAAAQFRSKEISKRSVVDDMVESNRILYQENEHPDHTVVIKYVPSVGDSKRAMDEYYSEIFMGGRNTLAIHNTCEDSLLAAPLILDLAILGELFTRIQYRIVDEQQEFEPLHSVLSLLSYFLKAPMVSPGAPVVNALARQRSALENILRACLGLEPVNEINLEHRIQRSASSIAN